MRGGFLRLERDDDFWRRPLARQDAILDRLLERRPGVLLDAPETVELPPRGTLPLVVGVVATYAELHGLDPALATAVVAVNVDTSELFAGQVEELDRVQEEPVGPPPAQRGVGAQALLACARERTGLAWAPGLTYLLDARLRERASNRVRVALVPAPGERVDPAVTALVLSRRRAHALRPLCAGLDLEDPLARALVPAEPGLALTVERVVEARAGAPATLRVGLRAALRPWERVAPAQPGDPAQEDAEVAAVVPVTLLVTGALAADPRIIPLRLPVRGPLEDVVAASFAVDLRTVRGFPRLPGTYYVSAFSGELAVGPAPVALVSPSELRGE